MDNPKLRNLQAAPFRQQGRLLVQLHDPARLSDKAIIVPREMLFLLSLFDGTNTIRDVQAAIFRQFGQLIPSEQVEEVVSQLDEALMLDSARFRAHLAALDAAFQARPTRSPASAGQAYPAEPEALAELLDGLLGPAEGPGQAPGAMVGLVAPHIDFERGAAAYGSAYRALARDCPAQLFVVFGTAHFAQQQLFTLTRKSYETPLGTLPTSTELVDALAARLGTPGLFAEELLHKNEHSIEFQAVCLRHALRGRSVEMLPILCGPLELAAGEAPSPRSVAPVGDFLQALRAVVAEDGRPWCAIAGADLSHVGPAFGHDFELTPEVMADVERADRETLACVERLDPDGFYANVQADGNARHICGAAAIYALLATAPATSCTLLDYRQAADYPLQRAVTFASLALYA